MIDAAFARAGGVRIIDLGGRENYWGMFSREYLESRKVHVTIVNLPSDLKQSSDPMFSHVATDGNGRIEFEDNSFDLAHSNSVIEHVGNWEKVKQFAAEVRRLAPLIYVQTPYYWFPVEPHVIKPFHHWLPFPLRVSITMKMRMGNRPRANDLDTAVKAVENEPFLLDRRMFRFLFPDCTLVTERLLLLPKSLIAYRMGSGQD